MKTWPCWSAHSYKEHLHSNVMKILLLSDIHGNYPALAAVAKKLPPKKFDCIVNCGDSTVYAPFPNQVLHWLHRHETISILGNTDRKVIKLLKGKSFKKPSKPEKRIMYTTTAATLNTTNKKYLLKLPKKKILHIQGRTVGIFHGSPEHANEFLFPSTAKKRFSELAACCGCNVVITGHSHTPYHKKTAGVDFINPGSIGRMFDGNPSASCAVLKLKKKGIEVRHYRISYCIDDVVRELSRQRLPTIYTLMYRKGRKLN